VNFRSSQTAQKLRGGYYTHADVAAFLTRWVLEIRPRSVLEPSCGDGVFLSALATLRTAPVSTQAFEIDAAEAAKARVRLRALGGSTSRVHAADFLRWALARLPAAREFDAALGNPPFIRYQYLDAALQTHAEKIHQALRLPFTRHTNAWVPFVVASLALLRPGGRLAMVVPAELLHVLHALGLRSYLADQCSRIVIFDPATLLFDGTLQGVVLLLAEKRQPNDTAQAQIAIVPVRDQSVWTQDASRQLRSAEFFAAGVLNGKWMAGLLTSHERALLERLRTNPGIRMFGAVARVDVGIVTGANQFFLVTDALVKEYVLENFAHPMFGRSEHVRGVIYDHRQHEQNRQRGLPTSFLHFGAAGIDALPASVQRYLRQGEAQGLPGRYKCRIREPWFAVPSVYRAPVAMLKRCHHFPRLVWNKAGAFTTDTAYRIVPERLAARNLVCGFVNSLTALSAELEGRHYGGGVLELVPSEIEKLLIPVSRCSSSALHKLDKSVRAGAAPETLLAQQDELILMPLGVSGADCEDLLAAWIRLRDRRHRVHRDEH
jgi:adenine-specific DNA-methyltransferase